MLLVFAGRLAGGIGRLVGRRCWCWITRRCLVWMGCFEGFWGLLFGWGFCGLLLLDGLGDVVAVGLIVMCLISGCFGFVGGGFDVDCCFWFVDLGLLLTLLMDWCDVCLFGLLCYYG